jgi:hypothetical protein
MPAICCVAAGTWLPPVPAPHLPARMAADTSATDWSGYRLLNRKTVIKARAEKLARLTAK